MLVAFAVAALTGWATSRAACDELLTARAEAWLVALSMPTLAILKLRGLRNFAATPLSHGFLAQRRGALCAPTRPWRRWPAP